MFYTGFKQDHFQSISDGISTPSNIIFIGSYYVHTCNIKNETIQEPIQKGSSV